MSAPASGLSRRRGGASSAPTSTSPGLSAGSSNHPTRTPSTSSNHNSRPTTPSNGPSANGNGNGKGAAVAGGGTGHRVAFDARDMETGEQRIMPKLTLMEEVLLLGLKDKQVRFAVFLSRDLDERRWRRRQVLVAQPLWCLQTRYRDGTATESSRMAIEWVRLRTRSFVRCFNQAKLFGGLGPALVASHLLAGRCYLGSRCSVGTILITHGQPLPHNHTHTVATSTNAHLALLSQGYLSFWNDNISYTLRGCIVLELALRHRIAMVKDPNRRRFPLADRYVCSGAGTQ